MPTAMTHYNLVRLANGYLINPRDGMLTPEPASIWLDANTGIIEHVAYDRRSPSVDASLEQYFRHVSDSQEFTRDLPERFNNCETYDLQGSVVSAGLIDIQINGCFGTDFSHWTDEDVLGRRGDEVYVDGLELAARGLWQTGVTSFLPTLIVSSKSRIYESAQICTDSCHLHASLKLHKRIPISCRSLKQKPLDAIRRSLDITWKALFCRPPNRDAIRWKTFSPQEPKKGSD